MQINSWNYQKSLSLFLALFLSLVIPISAAQEWTAVGSTGTVDESDIGQIGFYSGVAFMGGAGSATIRYNVTATPGLTGGSQTRFVMRYQDNDNNGPCARVEARLFRYNLNTGQVDQLMALDSNTLPTPPTTAGGFRVKFADDPGVSFDFSHNAYFVEVTLTRACSAGDARIGVLRLGRI